MTNPGAGQSRRYGTDKPHSLGQGPRMGDAGGTHGSGAHGRNGNGGERKMNHERENNDNRRRNNDRDRDEKY